VAAVLAGVQVARGQLVTATADAEVERRAGEEGFPFAGERKNRRDRLKFLARFGIKIDRTVTDGGDGFATGGGSPESVDLLVSSFGSHGPAE